jgi:hypothetical protein
VNHVPFNSFQKEGIGTADPLGGTLKPGLNMHACILSKQKVAVPGRIDHYQALKKASVQLTNAGVGSESSLNKPAQVKGEALAFLRTGQPFQ